jgi:Auxiliary Activity family 9 (formerly GH61)
MANFLSNRFVTWLIFDFRCVLIVNLDAASVNFTIPAAVPSGNYLIRFEHIGLHVASTVNGAQFYISCAQISITGGGNGTPSPLVAFPGAYSPTDPGLLIDIYYPVVSQPPSRYIR